MQKLLVSVGSVLLVGLLVWAGYSYPRNEKPSEPVSNVNDVSVRTFVENFVKEFKNVSLLADDVSAQIAAHYAAYVSPELIKKWQDRVEPAPGRYSSSPWPEKVNILSVIEESSGIYKVEANVIEMANGPEGLEPAAVYPVTLMVERNNNAWLVTSLEKGAYSQLPQRISVVGYWECLPHKDRTGPQTMECAFGIAIDQSDGHYAVNTMLMSSGPVDFPTGTKVRVEGVLTPANQLSSNHWRKYDMDGILNATSIKKISE